jgi:hypothetical protein
MNRSLVRCLLAGFLGLAGVTASSAQEGQTPGGYQFFSRRTRTTATAWTRVAEPATAKPSKRQAACCRISEDQQVPQPPAAVQSESLPAAADQPAVQQTNWGAEFGLGHGWTEEGYYPGMPNYGFGASGPYPLHGYRATYDWAGHTYWMHCYCDEGYCPHHCPGYRGACYVPCWNDAGTPIVERRCGRGSVFDCFWHMGGYERPCRKTDCPYICSGPPAYHSYGFPHGAAGDPNYRKPSNTGNSEPWRMRHDPYGAAPAGKPLSDPASPTVSPKPAESPVEAPVPKPQA